MSTIRKVAVLGAGVMGAQIAAHIANANIPVILFDMPAKDGDLNGIVLKALANLKKLKPSPLVVPSVADEIIPANYEQHLALLKECDLIVEAVAERMDIKQSLYNKIAPFIKPEAYFVSNTSGLMIHELAEALPESLRHHFCGVHFFNPPRYMHLVELIPHAKTDKNMLHALEQFLTDRLGKGCIYAKDTPNFIANRVGVFSMLATIYHAEQFNIPLEVVDALTGPALGRAKSATLRTADVVGLDTFAHVVNTLIERLPKDPWAKFYQMPAWSMELIQQGAIGQKASKGIYQKMGNAIYVWDIAQKAYRLADKNADPEVLKILQNKNPQERVQLLRQSAHPQAQFLWACLRDLFHYCAFHCQEIAHSLEDIDAVMCWGFGWQAGPFAVWKNAGWEEVRKAIEEEQKANKTMAAVALPEWTKNPSFKKPAASMPSEIIFENNVLRCWHQKDGVAILSFKTKLNTINDAVLDGIVEAIRYAEKDYRGLVIWQGTENFSAGANLAEADPSRVLEVVTKFQKTALAIRYANVPVVAAIRGLALGGGCELAMHSARIVAACESYIGLPEVGVGLLPAGGGSKEFALRAYQEARGDDPFRDLQQYFKQIAWAQVSSSAEEAQQRNYLRESDVIIMNADKLLSVAKQQVLMMSDYYQAPMHPRIPVVGKAGIATFMMQLINMREGSFISDHDYLIGTKVAEILCGGQLDAGAIVDETWYLRLEREAFVELARSEKTQARIAHMLKTGKPLRN